MTSSEKAHHMTALFLQTVDFTDMPISDAVDLYEQTYGDILKELQQRRKQNKPTTKPKSKFGL